MVPSFERVELKLLLSDVLESDSKVFLGSVGITSAMREPTLLSKTITKIDATRLLGGLSAFVTYFFLMVVLTVA